MEQAGGSWMRLARKWQRLEDASGTADEGIHSVELSGDGSEGSKDEELSEENTEGIKAEFEVSTGLRTN